MLVFLKRDGPEVGHWANDPTLEQGGTDMSVDMVYAVDVESNYVALIRSD